VLKKIPIPNHHKQGDMSEHPTISYRTESDSMGDKQIPSNVYYGIQTLAAS
jgi:hypothetical protein